MKILVINAGSSSLKYQLIDMETESMLAKGNCERIGIEGGTFTHKTADGRKKDITVEMASHTEAFKLVTAALVDKQVGVIKDCRRLLQSDTVSLRAALFSASHSISMKMLLTVSEVLFLWHLCTMVPNFKAF